MRRYSDASFTITAENARFSTAAEIHVTFSQAFHTVDVTGDDITVVDDENLTITLTQEQTSRLVVDEACEMQVNYIDANGLRKVSDTAVVPVLKNLLEKVLPDE